MGLEKVEGEECYKVLVTTNSGKTETRHYSKKTGYLVKTILKIMMGDTEAQVEAIYKNYKKIGGLVYPSTLVNNMPGQNKMITYDDVKINVQIPESIFEPPPQVKALLSNKGQEAAVPSLARPDLPSGASIRERYTQAVGGKEAFEKIKTEVRNGTINVGINIPLGSLPDNLPIDLSNGLTFAITDYRSDPNLHLREDWLLGECFQRMGSNGQNAWKWDAVHGYELWPDPAPLPAERNSSNWQDEYKAETVGTQMVEGEECYKVVWTKKLGTIPFEAHYYSKETGFMVKTEGLHTITGQAQGEKIYKDYRKVGDVFFPFQTIDRPLGQNPITTTYSEIKLNVDIPKSTFDLPTGVKALIGK